MPENTNNDSPDADRPTARADQEAPSNTGAAGPPGEIAAERDAREAVQHVANDTAQQQRPAAGSPTDTAP